MYLATVDCLDMVWVSDGCSFEVRDESDVGYFFSSTYSCFSDTPGYDTVRTIRLFHGVSCGSSGATSCALCPQTQSVISDAAGWCAGDCLLDEATGVCGPRASCDEDPAYDGINNAASECEGTASGRTCSVVCTNGLSVATTCTDGSWDGDLSCDELEEVEPETGDDAGKSFVHLGLC